MAFVLTFAQSSLLGIFSATIPMEAEELFHFSSARVGLLFIALFVPYLLLGSTAGKAVDFLGTRVVATTGYALLVPSLVMLGLPSYQLLPIAQNIILFCGVLALNGIFMVMGSSTSFVEASDVMECFEQANPEFFGDSGPFAQLYGFNALFMFSGLTVGPLVGGLLRSAFGFQVMLIVVAAFSGFMSLFSFLFIGGRQRTGSDHMRSP
jgi:MFS family permease